ncbi:protein phosphatase 1 regulatory subunit 12C isoform X2 [Girardinichthys multiradiatus]|uniref:protein phosphatase 1 regulatory subunit 12C isoform X2 n=1 Tax=Girardinichthys multiradiatus TaxID=208333 RepID=UPI001FADDE6D|nr:protein phosphatase 1 regulatory subunit 12C isoform X2 [Girardinichthys multiradiatus]
MGDTAKTKRREQLKRWAGSCTDRTSDVPRRRWRGDAEAEPSCDPPVEQQPDPAGRDEISPIPSGRKRVRFDSAAEFLAACASGDTEEAKAMLEETEQSKTRNGENLPDIINCSNSDGITALHQACIDGSIEIVTFLLERGANVNQVDSEGWTPLHVASSCGYPDIAEYLLQKGASLTAVNCDGDVPLDIALDETTESLLHNYTQRQGVDVDAAKRKEEEQMMSDARTWLNEGPPDDVRHPRTGATPLHVAAAKGYVEALKILCQCGLDVSATDFDGWTPLHAAAHWGQEEACRILAEQLCNMEARSNGGQTPFDVADESVSELLEELSQKQANWRNERSISERQNQPGFNATNALNKRRRTSVCRMSSKDKINVQDLSKERGISGGLDMSEEKESSTESSTVSSPDAESVTTSTISPAEKEKAEDEEQKEEEEEKEQDKASRTARVQPTPQTKEAAAENPNAPNADKKQQQPKQFQAADRDEESESQRKARCRLMRQSRRLTQGVTLTELKEAEKSVGKAADPPPPPRNVQSVSPIITVTPAERDNDPAKQVESEGDSRLGAKDRRRGRKERRSTGIVPPVSERDDGEAQLEDTNSNSTEGRDLSADFKTLYIKVLQENMTLKDKLQDMELQLSQNKVELERLRQSQESSTERPALLELERFEKLALQRKAVELEDELKVLGDLKADNQRLKDENAALIRVISKLSR